MVIHSNSFTKRHDGLQRLIIIETNVAPRFDPRQTASPLKYKKYNGIWDTGATSCVITEKVINELRLIPITFANVRHANGVTRSPVFPMNLCLPSNVCFINIRATRGILPPNVDVLIGMDIITYGDFALTNKNGKTQFSFRVPSISLHYS